MSDQPTLLYLEADDEITAVARRVRAADTPRVVIVAPGRSRATSSAVALRLLERVGTEEGRELVVVGDALTRSLATEAGLAAHASVEDARAGGPAEAATPAEPRHAAIHVVRGPTAEETAPTMAAAAPPPADVAADETRPMPVVRPRPPAPRAAAPRPRAPRRASRRAIPLAGVLVVAGALLATAGLVGAVVLPAATVRITPRSEAIGPVEYELPIEDAVRTQGSVQRTATVTATGTYAIQAAATGTVVFRNFNIGPVDVPAGTLVAAGEQAFATTEDIVVPEGSLTNDGRIAAGEGAVGVVAAAVGPAANVGAEAIDTVLNDETRRRLRGFPQNNARLVINPEATSGGVDTTGVEITQADVDAAIATLREDLTAGVSEALAGTDAGLFADPTAPAEPTITGADGLVGTRDQPEAEITGELAYDRLSVDPAVVEERAAEEFADDGDQLPAGHELLADTIAVDLGEASRDGDRLIVEARVSARSTPALDRDAVVARIVGLGEAEAEAALASLGTADVSLWPGWVTSVPESDWRVEVQIEGVDGALPAPSAS